MSSVLNVLLRETVCLEERGHWGRDLEGCISLPKFSFHSLLPGHHNVSGFPLQQPLISCPSCLGASWPWNESTETVSQNKFYSLNCECYYCTSVIGKVTKTLMTPCMHLFQADSMSCIVGTKAEHVPKICGGNMKEINSLDEKLPFFRKIL